MLTNPIYKYWGKAFEDSYHLLVYHCLDVAAVGKVWLDQSPAFVKRAAKASGLSGIAFTEWFVFFLALHDIGKFDIRFQNLRKDLLKNLQNKEVEIEYKPRHDQRGFQFWNESISPSLCSFFGAKGVDTDLFRDWLAIYGLITTGHHGTPPSGERKSNLNNEDVENCLLFVDDSFKLLVSEDSQNEIVRLCEDEDLFDIAEESSKHFSWQLAGLITLCDWIASGDGAFTYEKEKINLADYFENACSKAEKAIARAEVISADLSETMGIEHLFPKFSTTQTPLQKFCNEVKLSSSPQLWILEDVAGAGKTEASLTLASRILGEGGGSGCFVALPTMATSNAMYERMTEVYSRLYRKGSRPSLSLSHGSHHLSDTFRNSYKTNLSDLPQDAEYYNEDSDEGKAHCSQWLADNSKKAFLSDVGVGTVDQILMAGLPVRYQSLRAFGIAQKVLIIDEVHAFDAYMLQLLVNVIEAQATFGGSVILLSATLPQLVREKFCTAFADGIGIATQQLEETETFPLVTAIDKNGIKEIAVETRSSVAREVGVDFCEKINEIYTLIEKSVADGKCVCWIRNTISDVTTSFNELKNRGIDNLDMFHSRFALNDRLDIEKRVCNRFGKESTPDMRAGQVLVASQVVEQSLDLDFDVMISDLAPIDLLIQRAGRLHRHNRGEREKPVFYVHTPIETNKPTENWYAEAFQSASYIYKDVALLWRTKEILRQQKRLKMPEEARLLVESVYGEEGILTPNVFIKSEDDAWADTLNQRSLANFNRLSFEQGYSRMSSDANKWESEEKVSTRLSDPSNTLYLCKWDGGKVMPLKNEGLFSWDLSSLSIRQTALSSIEYSGEISTAIEELKKQKRFQYNTLFVVFESDSMRVAGKNGSGKDVLVTYSSDGGLIIKKTSDYI